MTKPQIALVPFGKYKGQPVEALAQDRAYCEWLAQQEWFRSKFVGIHTLIVNHFGEPSETPEHNALQARFLEYEWCQRFALCARIEDAHSNTCRRIARRATEHPYLITSEQRWRRELHAAQLPNARWSFAYETAFEVDGADVQLIASIVSESVGPPCTGDCPKPCEYNGFESTDVVYRIECKPTLGDEYPAVLRQMKAAKTKHLVVGAVQSQVLTADDVTAFFERSGVTLLTVAAIEACALKWSYD
jgi:hypothetical protein